MDTTVMKIGSLALEDMADVEKLQALQALESGQVVHLLRYHFDFQASDRPFFLSEKVLDAKHKNLSYDIENNLLAGFNKKECSVECTHKLQNFMQSYALFAKDLIIGMIPRYADSLRWGRTSYRPAQVLGRNLSKRKDDTRLHVDSFAATPVHGLRILRVFCNINPYGEPRVWQLGEPFTKVATAFAPRLPVYRPMIAKLLHRVKATKALRGAYDHYQLKLHDAMKLDDDYQKTVNKTTVHFQPQSTWLVFTDNVSHAALSGQFLLEQTFYLPVEAMQDPRLSPRYYWQQKQA